MKKLVLICILCIVSNIHATDFTVNGINYTGTDAAPYTAAVADNTSFVGTEASIPSTVEYEGITYSVTSISDSAFLAVGLTSITIPDSVISIGNFAFYENSLTSVTIPDSVTSIGERTFSDNGLTSVIIGNSVTSIGERALSENALTSVTIPNSVITIGDYAFAENDLNNLTIGNSVTSIGERTFSENDLTSITIPGSVTSIGNEAFGGNNLTSVISESLDPAILLSNVFDDRSLIDLTIPAGTAEAYITANWIGFNSVTEDANLSVTENSILENLTLTTNANVIVITTTNGIRLENISLYNMSGQRVLVSQQTEMSISHLASGVYIAQLTTNLGTVAKKFVK